MENNNYERLREEALRTGDTTLLLIAQAMEIIEARIALLERKVNACIVEMDLEY